MNNIEKEKDLEDPAKTHPWRRHIVRSSFTYIFIYLILIIPGLVFFIISIVAGFPTEIGMLSAFVSLFLYLFILWKKELWNYIRR
jgi:hypothetical protein